MKNETAGAVVVGGEDEVPDHPAIGDQSRYGMSVLA